MQRILILSLVKVLAQMTVIHIMKLPKVSSVGENKHTPPHTPSPTHPGGNSGGSPTKPNHPVHTPIIHKRNKNNLLNRRDEIIKYIKIMY